MSKNERANKERSMVDSFTFPVCTSYISLHGMCFTSSYVHHLSNRIFQERCNVVVINDEKKMSIFQWIVTINNSKKSDFLLPVCP